MSEKRFSLEYYNGIPRIFDAHEESYYTISDSYLLSLLNVMDKEITALRKRVGELEVGSIEKLQLEDEEAYGEGDFIVITEKNYHNLICVKAVADDVNEWLKRTNRNDTAHQRSLEAALKGEA